MPRAQSKKYIFIDTNIYRDLFSESDEFSDEFLQLIIKLITIAHTPLLMPQQVKEEIERNCISDWVLENENSLKNKLTKLDSRANILDLEYSSYSKSAINKIKKGILTEKKDINKKIVRARKQFLSTKSSPRRKLSKLLKLAEFISETREIRENALFREGKNNPPKDRGRKLGDKIIWETLLSYFEKKRSEKPLLIFVTRDNTAWRSETSEKLEFNPWLQKEYSRQTKGKIILVDKLSLIPGLTPTEQQKIAEEEVKEARRRTTLMLKAYYPNLLRTVNSFDNADRLMRRMALRIGVVDKEGIEQIIQASIDNKGVSDGPYNQVTGASYAPTFFNGLLDQALKIGADLKILKDFYSSLNEADQERFYSLRKKLQDCGVSFSDVGLKYIDEDDIPF